MLEYLFQEIPKMIFEPLAVTVLLWALLAFFFFRKRNKALFRFFTGAVLFMIAWRVACHSIMLSSRYAAFLIYPAVIFCACFTVKCAPFFRWVFKKFKLQFPWRNAFCRFLPAAVLVGLSIGCLIRTFRIDHYSDYRRKAAFAYLKHRKAPGEVHIAHDEFNRISWYTGHKRSEAYTIYLPDNTPFFPKIKNTVQRLKNVPGEHYLFFFLNKGEPTPSPESMNFSKDHGSWQIIARYYTTKRKKKEFLVARYTPVCPNIREWKGPVPPMPKGNFHANSDFEKPFAEVHRKSHQISYRKNKIRGYEDLNKRKLPHGWWHSLGKWNANNPPDIRLSDKAPLAGKYSLSVDSRLPRRYAHCCSWYYFNKRCQFTIFVRAEGDKPSIFQVFIPTRNLKLKKYRREMQMDFKLQPGKTYRIHGTIPADEFEKDWRSFSIQFGVRGFVTVDQLSLVPY